MERPDACGRSLLRGSRVAIAWVGISPSVIQTLPRNEPKFSTAATLSLIPKHSEAETIAEVLRHNELSKKFRIHPSGWIFAESVTASHSRVAARRLGER